MNEMNNAWEKIGIDNDFLFGKIMRKPEICKETLQTILPELEIERIEYPESQKSIKEDIDARGVRLDVYVKDNNDTVYNIEMQVLDTKSLPKRSRYYQSMIDLQLLDKGQSYKDLNRSYIIFICPFDLYGKSRHKYTFKNICEEDTSIQMGDEATKIFLYAKGELDDVDENLRAFLDYVAGKKSDNSFVGRLEKEVEAARKNREWRHEYMTLLMRDQENMEKGMEKGMEKTMLDSIKSLVKNLNMTLEEAMEALDVPKSKRESYKQMLKS